MRCGGSGGATARSATLRLFLAWARAFHDPAAEFVLSLHLHTGNDEAAARRWWSHALQLDAPDFTKTFVKASGTGHRKNRLVHGVCRIRMRRATDAWHRTLVWIGVVAAALAGRPDD